MIIAITGSSGLVGSALIHALEGDGHLIRPVVRRVPRSGANEIRWDPDKGTIDAAEFANVDAVVHLAGENIAAQRWTPVVQRQDSATAASAARNCFATRWPAWRRNLRVLVSASAIGYYGSRGDELVDESATARSRLSGGSLSAMGSGDALREGCGHPRRQSADWLRPQQDGGGLAKMLTPFRLGARRCDRQRTTIHELDRARRPRARHPIHAFCRRAGRTRERRSTDARHEPRVHQNARQRSASADHLSDACFRGETGLRRNGRRHARRRQSSRAALLSSNARFEFRYPQLELALRHILA